MRTASLSLSLIIINEAVNFFRLGYIDAMIALGAIVGFGLCVAMDVTEIRNKWKKYSRIL